MLTFSEVKYAPKYIQLYDVRNCVTEGISKLWKGKYIKQENATIKLQAILVHNWFECLTSKI